MEINHFSHEHTLVLSEEKMSKSFSCRICGEYIFGLSYCCQICPYVLHKWCGELPRELLPNQQSLVLSPIESSPNPSLCQICDYPIESPVFAYSTNKECSSTKIHVECASFPVELLFRCDRRLTVWKENECCSLCQIKDDFPKLISEVDKSYCHIHCAMLPSTMKHSVHLHELTLRPPLIEKDLYFEFICDACEKERDPTSPIYYCESCEFVAHIGCGFSGPDADPPPIQDILGTHPTYKIMFSESEEEEEEEEKEEGDDVYGEGYEIEHFIHKHALALKCFKRLGMHLEEKCRGCGQSIFGMTYACIKENCEWGCFYLHKWCAQLPKVIHCSMHPSHGLLKLIESRLKESDDQENFLVEDYSTICEFCGMEIGLMCYGCDKCDFEIHGICALLQDDLNHHSHEHTLNVVINKGVIYDSDDNDYEISKFKLPLGSSEQPLCQACGFLCEDVSLECKSCDFHLHVHCFLLPSKGKHTTHKHDLNLTYTYEEDPTALEYICDTCEKPRTPNCWVYCCPDPKCYIVSHVDCVVPKYFTTIENPS